MSYDAGTRVSRSSGTATATLAGVNPQRQSAQKAGAYRILQVPVADLRKAERTLSIVVYYR